MRVRALGRVLLFGLVVVLLLCAGGTGLVG